MQGGDGLAPCCQLVGLLPPSLKGSKQGPLHVVLQTPVDLHMLASVHLYST